jgi:hypothetical protein
MQSGKEIAVKKKTQKKLTLSRETLQSLAAGQIKLAGAGYDSILICPPPPPTSDSVQYCCAEI